MKNILIAFFKKQNKCTHKNALLTSETGYCPDCGQYLEKNYYLIGRLAILKDYRKQNLGSKLIQRVIKDILKQDKKTTIELHAQLDKVEFYKKNGFEPFGTTFIEANIDHIGMRYKK